MSNIASLITSGSPASSQGKLGKASANTQANDDGFAKQLSENKSAKGTASQNSKNNPMKAKENEVEVESELSALSSHSTEVIKLDYELNQEAYPASTEIELNIDELELNSNPAIVGLPNEIGPEDTMVPFEDFTIDDEASVLATDVDVSLTGQEVDVPLTGQEILAALNTQLSSKMSAADHVQKTKPQLNTVNAESVPSNSIAVELDPALKSKSADIINLNKTSVTKPDADTAGYLAQNVDVPKANNNQNVDTVKVPANNAVLSGLASGGGLSDSGADPQGEGSSNQFANQVNKAGIKLDGVDVLEARVFPAISSSNSTNITDALLKTSQVSGNTGLQNSDPVYNTSQSKTMNTLKIQLVPANLGTVTAVMKLTGEELQVELQVDNIEAYRKLSSDSASIVNTLKNQGFGIEQVNVQLMNGDRGSAQQGQQQNGQLFQDQNRQEASSNFGRDRGDSSSSNSNELNQELANNESDVLQAPQVTDLSNGVYL